MRVYSEDEHINIGTGEEIAIGDFARLVAKVVGYEGRLVFDTRRDDGTPLKRLDVSRLAATGWRYKVPLEDGLRRAYASFRDSLATGVRER
jgi:GDP-L-fucose synthase